MPIIRSPGLKFEFSASVVIVGAGACGLCAALAAAEAGADVLVLEQDAIPSGTTGMSSGLIPAACTHAQCEAGITTDSAEIFVADLLKKNRGRTDVEMLSFIARQSTQTVEWLIALGLPLSLVPAATLPGHSQLRFHATPGRSGSELIGSLLDAVTARGIDVVTEARVQTLFVDNDDRVLGVEFVRPDGAVETVGCRALVLASCGFAANPELVRRYLPEIAGALAHTHSGNVGDALAWGEALGAATADLTGYQGHASVFAGHGLLLHWITINQGGFQVNARGERFADESRGYSEQAVDVLAQPGGVAWQIYDGRIHAIMQEFSEYQDAISVNAMRRADSVAELAQIAGLPLDALSKTFGAVTAMCEGAIADPLGRDFTQSTPLAPPYYAAKVTAALFHTQGGLVVDKDARVLRADGRRLPNLFAGGGAARGISGPTADGYVGGNGLMTATTLGRIGGQAAARLALG